MKHLRKYNESVEQITSQDVKDILLELEDEGFKVKIEHCDWLIEDIYTAEISKYNKSFKYDEVKETLLRLKEYLGVNLYNTYVTTTQNDYTSCIFDENFIRGNMLFFNKDDTHKYDTEIKDITDDDIYNIEFYIQNLK